MTKIRLRDVASKAGVSLTTASEALNGRGRVSPETRTRIEQIAADLGYRPDPAARSLRAGRSRLIGLVVSPYRELPTRHVTNDFLGPLIQEYAIAAVRRGFAIVVLPPTLEGALHDFPLAGVSLVDTDRIDPLLDEALSLGVPVATNFRDDDRRVKLTVDNDVAAATTEVLDHLATQGARKPGLLSSVVEGYYRETCEAAYQAWCKSRRIKPRLVRVGDDHGSARAGAVELLDARADAIYALDDYGLAVLEAAIDIGLDVPDDLLVAVCAENPQYAVTDPPLTAMSLLPDQLASTAVDLLIDAIEHGGSRKPRHEWVPTKLMIRQSSQPSQPRRVARSDSRKAADSQG